MTQKRHKIIAAVHLILEKEGSPCIMEQDKYDELKWFKITKLPNNIIPYIGSAIKNIGQGNYYSEFGWQY
ncbi:MAG: hypothetical protein A2233_00610 [Candidatus Kerfeldbacteria bacterium RIFOXYA2_FULL_38_24]|uniref:Nudix hydrolase domain-containing protein n=1 Tax=Candidatus Kerfeldbacteria bacterium RIFOXYB2_FULL_38_14 TaxID=1798547 RepID=A0A1G2BBZ0_9BACT|nr:MAG: hypothetical protein A2233_00610 [Candidatus Kerfeldbacteria bacterium RIFOXYA2_FULL_38_24]OGY86661.1 MAG: hypothetical protein A2319_02900 [Candidatus Kerfeldbacteria bacterium RIFOXYB2_FULL_38_14]OGY88547.1 MAG: hypothetical protein A2458_05350 [Candidatus Kerfeldbacteria bacterium RIFOXYC2_FULL_38_9]